MKHKLFTNKMVSCQHSLLQSVQDLVKLQLDNGIKLGH